jgi:hypothetical protein
MQITYEASSNDFQSAYDGYEEFLIARGRCRTGATTFLRTLLKITKTLSMSDPKKHSVLTENASFDQ